MKRASVAATVLIAMTVAGGVALAGKGTKKVKSTASLSYVAPSDPYGEGALKGRVQSGKVTCKKRRTVALKKASEGTVAQIRTNKRGRFKEPVPAGDGKYKARARRAVVKRRNGKRLVCKAATSARVQVG